MLAGGEEIAARAVVSAVDLPRTFLRMLDPALLDPDDVRRVRNYRIQGMASKVNFALSGLPAFAGQKGADAASALRGRIHIGADIDALERAFDAAKYGEPSPRPYLDITIPSITDPGLCPAGQHVMSVYVQYTPYRLKTGSWKERADEVADATTRLLEEYAPGFGALVLGQTGPDAAGPRGDLRAHRRPPLARRARPRPALRHAAAPRVGALSLPDRGPLPLQRGNPSRRRGHGRAGGERGARDRQGPAARPGLTGPGADSSIEVCATPSAGVVEWQTRTFEGRVGKPVRVRVPPPAPILNVVRFGDVRIDFAERKVTVRDQALHPTPTPSGRDSSSRSRESANRLQLGEETVTGPDSR